MNATDAADLTVHAYPGGSESLSPRMNMSAAVLRNKVNPNNERNHLTLAEADRLMRVTNDHRILQALAAEHGYTLQVAGEEGSQDSVVSMVLNASSAGGELARTIHDAMADGVITEREMLAISDAGFANQKVIMALIQRLQSMAASRPASA